jgi:acyl carrier protein
MNKQFDSTALAKRNYSMDEVLRDKIHKRLEIVNTIKHLLVERLNLPLNRDEISEDAPLFGSGLGLDSIDSLEIVVAIEATFGVSIADGDVATLRSINIIADYVLANQEGPQNT